MEQLCMEELGLEQLVAELGPAEALAGLEGRRGRGLLGVGPVVVESW
jgi:hypothetical protein